jgi:hypothetical protein
MKYICAQPAIKYFAWQVDVFINSLLNVGVTQQEIHIINSSDKGIDDYFKILQNKYPNVLFEYYNDTREYKKYIPSIKQHLLYHHYSKHSYLQHEPIFLMDADAILTKPIDFSSLLKDNIWYFSDTNSYLNYDYICSKGDEVLHKMLGIAGISEHVVKSNNENAGGAQYLFKNVAKEYWEEVVYLSHALYEDISNLNYQKQQEDKNYFPLQIWTAEMWALLWVAWKNGQITLTHPLLNFCWATDLIDRWDKTNIFHNAGVTPEMKNLFNKSKYINNFPDLNLDIDKTKCSYNYYNIVKSVLA